MLFHTFPVAVAETMYDHPHLFFFFFLQFGFFWRTRHSDEAKKEGRQKRVHSFLISRESFLLWIEFPQPRAVAWLNFQSRQKFGDRWVRASPNRAPNIEQVKLNRHNCLAWLKLIKLIKRLKNLPWALMPKKLRLLLLLLWTTKLIVMSPQMHHRWNRKGSL